MKELKSVRVENIRKVADGIGIKLGMDMDEVAFRFERDLLKNKDAVKFVKDHKKYFTVTDKNLLREFYEKTGLILMNVFESSGKIYRATMYGFLKNDPDAYGGHYNCVFNNHLTSYLEVSDFSEPKEDEYYEHDYDKDEAWGFTNVEVAALNENPELIWDDDYEHCYKVGPHKNFIGAFGEHFVIKEGKLYRDGVKIEENVRTVFRLNDYTSMIIFENNCVEYLERHSHEHPVSCVEYNKIIYGTYFIALLFKNKFLNVYAIDEEDPDTNCEVDFDCVEDIEFIVDPFEWKDTSVELLIFPDKNDENKYIKFPITGGMPCAHDIIN